MHRRSLLPCVSEARGDLPKAVVLTNLPAQVMNVERKLLPCSRIKLPGPFVGLVVRSGSHNGGHAQRGADEAGRRVSFVLTSRLVFLVSRTGIT
jgi:hypothetical protein